jgi:hypothetical protein
METCIYYFFSRKKKGLAEKRNLSINYYILHRFYENLSIHINHKLTSPKTTTPFFPPIFASEIVEGNYCPIQLLAGTCEAFPFLKVDIVTVNHYGLFPERIGANNNLYYILMDF